MVEIANLAIEDIGISILTQELVDQIEYNRRAHQIASMGSSLS